MKKFLIIALIIVWSIFGIKFSMKSNLKETKEIWNTIIEKIELYKKEKWTYPQELTDLIPKYYDKIPKSKSGTKKFNYYYIKEKQSFQLFSTFWLSGTYLYDSQKKEWINF